MMEQTKTASRELELIERRFFWKARPFRSSFLEGEGRRVYKLAQVERLLTTTYCFSQMADYLSDKFWTADEGRVQKKPVNPLLLPSVQQYLTWRQMARLRLILEIAGLCHDISLHYKFDLKEAFGLSDGDFWVSNEQLVEWLTATEYEHVAMHTAYIMKKHAIDVYAREHYLPAQDMLAELFSMEHHELIREPESTDMPPRAYVKTILDALLQIERHWQRGRKLKLRPDVVILHDEIYGMVPRRFDKLVLAAAEELCDYLEREVFGRFAEKVHKKSFKQFETDLMARFAEKVREVRSRYLAGGWVEDDSLEFSYLMAHAERCGWGFWHEEDDAL